MVRNHHAVIPAKAGIQFIKQFPHSGQSRICGVVSLREGIFNCLDSRFRGNDDCFNVYVMNYVKINNGIEQARLAVRVAKAFFENYVSSGFAGKNPDRYLIDRVIWLGELALSDAGMFVFTQWGIDVMEAAPKDLITNKKFHTEHWPRLDARIRSKRDRKKGTP